MIRLDKFLADCGIGTRSQVKKFIKGGLVSCDGVVVKDSSMQIDENTQTIKFKGNTLTYHKYTYLMLNKPSGVISATKDRELKTVIDILPDEYKNLGLFPVGRLDKDTLGLLLLSNDGELAHNSLSPRKHIDKTYYVEYNGTLPKEAVALFKEGIELKDFKCKTAVIEPLGDNCCNITITEGKYHQVKRMFAALGCKVTYLKRIKFGNICLDQNLGEGQCRLLNDEEMLYISKFCGK